MADVASGAALSIIMADVASAARESIMAGAGAGAGGSTMTGGLFAESGASSGRLAGATSSGRFPPPSLGRLAGVVTSSWPEPSEAALAERLAAGGMVTSSPRNPKLNG